MCKKIAGRSHATHVPKELEAQVRAWNEEHKRIKALLKDISAISEQIIRGFVQERKTRKRVAQSLKLADSGVSVGEHEQ